MFALWEEYKDVAGFCAQRLRGHRVFFVSLERFLNAENLRTSNVSPRLFRRQPCEVEMILLRDVVRKELEKMVLPVLSKQRRVHGFAITQEKFRISEFVILYVCQTMKDSWFRNMFTLSFRNQKATQASREVPWVSCCSTE